MELHYRPAVKCICLQLVEFSGKGKATNHKMKESFIIIKVSESFVRCQDFFLLPKDEGSVLDRAYFVIGKTLCALVGDVQVSGIN